MLRSVPSVPMGPHITPFRPPINPNDPFPGSAWELVGGFPHAYAELAPLVRVLGRLREPHCCDVVEMSYVASYDCRMRVVNFRTDERSERALAELMADGSSASDALRQALVDAVRLRRREQMRIESLALMNDDADRAESRKVLSEMDELRAW